MLADTSGGSTRLAFVGDTPPRATFEDVTVRQRIYQLGPAWVAWKSGRYFPDLVVRDSACVRWLLKAKANKAAVDSVEVQDNAKGRQVVDRSRKRLEDVRQLALPSGDGDADRRCSQLEGSDRKVPLRVLARIKPVKQ